MNQQADGPLLEMGLFEHLAELRKRLVRSSIAVVICSCIAYSYSREIMEFLMQPYQNAFRGNILIGTGPAEAFILRMKVAIFSGIILASPVIFYQLWLFIAPGLYDKEKRFVLPFTLSTTLLFLFGAGFCFQAVFPFAFEFFKQQYDAIAITPTIKVSEYLSTVMLTIIGFGLVFEMPLLAYFLGRLGLIDHRTLLNGARYAIVIIFIVSAVLTPPDVLTQFLMAGPLLILYGLSILVVKYTASPADEDGA